MMSVTHERDRPQAENLAEVPFHKEYSYFILNLSGQLAYPIPDDGLE